MKVTLNDWIIVEEFNTRIEKMKFIESEGLMKIDDSECGNDLIISNTGSIII